MNRNTIISLIILITASCFIYMGIKSKNNNKPLRYLPYYGVKEVKKNQQGSGVDTLYKTIADFSFTDQMGKTVTQETLKGSIYVADYFFCTCQSICPIMSNEMERLAKHFKEDKNVKFISHTVNPEHDSVNVLADYAKAHEAKYGQWYLVTGNKRELYNLARNSYMLDASEGDGGAGDFLHTPNFALIDKQRHIRGYYDGTDSLEVNKLMNDIVLLEKEN